LVVGAPYEINGPQKTGDVYKCSVNGKTNSTCSKLNLGRVTLSNVSERKDNMRLGLSLTTNPKDSSFLACSPLWSHECGSSYYTTGMCSRVNSNFRYSKSVAPALQRERNWQPIPLLFGSQYPLMIFLHLVPECQTYMDIIIVLDGSNSIYPWAEVQNFLIRILKKFYIGPGQIQVGVVQYGEDAVHEFHLNDYRSVKDVVEAAKHIEQRGVLKPNSLWNRVCPVSLLSSSEAYQKGGRKGAKKVMIVITDGESHDSPDLEKAIEGSEKDNVTRYAVAVKCQTYMDIIIVLDGSNSIYPWAEVQNFLIRILKKFYIGPGQIQVTKHACTSFHSFLWLYMSPLPLCFNNKFALFIFKSVISSTRRLTYDWGFDLWSYFGAEIASVGVVQYGEDAVHEFHLNDYRSVKDVVEAAKHIEQRGGTETRTAFGIEFARSEAYQKGGRKGAKKVMIVITDGESHDSPDLEKAIEGSEKDNVTRYAV
ncbi:hypothetical protein E2320_013600, partial [Naja naja]